MGYPNRDIGDRICEAVEARIRSWGFKVTDHELYPKTAPGDFVVANGNGLRLYSECKSYRIRTRGRTPAGNPRKTLPPGRPMVTSARHEWLEDWGGIYIFARYSIEEDQVRIRNLRWARAQDVHVRPDRRVSAMSHLVVQELPPFTKAVVHRLLSPDLSLHAKS